MEMIKDSTKKHFIETAISYGITAGRANEALVEAEIDSFLHRDEKGYRFMNSLKKVTDKLVKGLIECQMTCIWY